MVAASRTPQSFHERVGAWRHLPTFVRLVWDASPTLTLASFALRLARSAIPVLVLYVSKLIFDAVVTEAKLPHPAWSAAEWIDSGRLVRVGWLITLELGLAVMADFSSPLSSLFDSLPAETYSNFASMRLLENAACLDLNQFLIDRFRRFADTMFVDNRRLAARHAIWGSLLSALGTIAYYIAYAAIIWRTMAGEFSFGDMTFLVGSFLRLKSLLDGLLLGFSQVASQALYLEDLFAFFEVRPRVVSPCNPRSVPTPIRWGFVFEDVGFRYSGAKRWAVRHLNLQIPVGEVLALVGENGAGKTTIVKLLARLYDPTEGRILLDGRDLRDYDLAELRNRIGVVFQDFVRFHFTAAENIAMGRVEAASYRDRIEQAAVRCLADAIIDRLPFDLELPF